MNKLSALAVIACLFTLVAPDSGTQAMVKLRIHSHHNDSAKISCNTARHMVREQGYNPVKIKSCISTVYSFYAVRNGRTYIFHVDSRRRSIWRG